MITRKKTWEVFIAAAIGMIDATPKLHVPTRGVEKSSGYFF